MIERGDKKIYQEKADCVIGHCLVSMRDLSYRRFSLVVNYKVEGRNLLTVLIKQSVFYGITN
jgi:hypothetical protein